MRKCNSQTLLCNIKAALTPSLSNAELFFLQEYEKQTKISDATPEAFTNLAACYFFLGMYNEADAIANKGTVLSADP